MQTLTYRTTYPRPYKEGRAIMVTFGQLARAYLDTHLKGRPSYPRYNQIYRAFFDGTWSERPADFVSRLDVVCLQQSAGARTQIRKAVAFVQQTYSWASRTVNPATRQLYWNGGNPAANLKMPRDKRRERMASLDELRRILLALPTLYPPHAAFIAVRLTAPCRIKELCETEPKHWTRNVTMAGCPGGAIWHKPITKNGTDHTIYVAPQAMAFLNQLQWSRPYLFQGAYGHHWSENGVGKMWRELMAELGIDGLQLLDLRRTLASYLYKLYKRKEVDDLTIKAVLNHYDGRPVAIYTKLDIEYLAGILQGYADWLWNLPNDPTLAPTHPRPTLPLNGAGTPLAEPAHIKI